MKFTMLIFKILILTVLCVGILTTLVGCALLNRGQVVQENAPLNRDYPMPLAETASILCQTLMAKKMISEMTDPLEKLTVLNKYVF